MKPFIKTLVDQATEPYRASGRFAWYFARGKLRGDPVFAGLLELGAITDGAQLLDLGCGQGLLASWLAAARRLYEAGLWHADWPAPPRLAAYRGVEL
ncbi:MAG TPA: methyltransferase type 11, partial [Gammaproteobacteria bacterium]